MKKILLILLVCFMCTKAAAASEEEKPSVLGEAIDKTLSPLDIVFSPYKRLDPIVVTPTRYEDSSLDVSSNISIIDAEQIKKSQAKYVPDLLRSQPGITVSDLLGNGKAVRVDMRGFGDSSTQNVLVMVDGRRTNQIDLSGTDWVQIDINAIERIEIVRGPRTVLYGDNATAGVVNIITKTGKGIKPEISFNYETGSYRYSAYKGHISGGSDFLDYFGMISTTYNNGYRINDHLETVDYDGNLTFKPTDYLKLHCSAGYHKDWYGLPGAVKPVDINAIGRRGSTTPDNRAKTEDYYYMFTPEFERDFGFGLMTFSGDILSRSRRTSSISYSNSPFWDDIVNKSHIRTFGVTPKVAITTDFLNVSNRILAGLDYYTNADEINSGQLSATDSVIIDKSTLGLYINDTVELPFSLVLNSGFRGEWANYKFDQQAVLVNKTEERPFEYACEAGLSYKYNKKSSVYARYSRSFRFPVVDEWYSSAYVDSFSGLIAGGLNTGLKPQTANNYEFGIKEYSSKYLNLTADYYVMDVKNELYYNPSTYKNSVYHQTMHHGLELQLDTYFLDSIHATASYVFQKAFYVGGSFAGNSIPMVPSHKFSVGFNYTFMDCVTFGYLANFVGDRWFANDLKNDMPKLKAHVVHDIKLAYNKYGLEVYGAINNLLDAEYSEYGVLDMSLTRPGYYPSPGRNFSVGVKYKF